MKKTAPSLKKQLLIWISFPVLLAGFITAVMAFAFSWHEIEEVYDAQMVHSAKTLLQMTEHEILENGSATISLGGETSNLQHRYERKMAFRIWHKDRLVTQSGIATDFGDLQAPPGFSDQTIKGKPWRFFVYIDPEKNLRIETSERYAIRYELIWQLMMSLIIPALIFIPIIFVSVWLGARKALRPLKSLSRAVDTRHSDDLTAIGIDHIPTEVIPLVHAMNRLLRRMEDSFHREREFTDNAAHELRTPLAAMKTQTQVLAKKLGHYQEGREGFENLNATIDRAHHLVEQLLDLARLQNQTFEMADTDLSECLRQEIHNLAFLIEKKQTQLDLDIADHVIVRGHADSLSLLLRNLIDNAIKYSPMQGRVSITLTPSGTLQIRDNGPGLSDKDKDSVFDRFVRADKTGQTGSGLGLSIAGWIARMHHMTIQLSDNAPQGLCVTLTRTM